MSGHALVGPPQRGAAPYPPELDLDVIEARAVEVRRLRAERDEAQTVAVLLATRVALWRALAQARSRRGIPMLEGVGEELARRAEAERSALDGLRAAGVDPDAPEGR